MGKLRPNSSRTPGLRSTNAVVQQLWRADPVTAATVDRAWREHTVARVRTGYSSCARQYVEFCRARRLPRWPTCDVRLAAWLVSMVTRVKYTSMASYLAAVRDHQLSLGYKWCFVGNERLRRTLRWIKRTFPCSTVGVKFAVTLDRVKIMLRSLPHWPNLGAMDHDDRVFALASVVGVLCMLRGGEFLASPSSDRAVLHLKSLTVRNVDGRETLVVSVPQPKATFWLDLVDVPCHGDGDPSSPFGPVSLHAGYLLHSPAVKKAKGNPLAVANLPAFHRADGSAVTKAWMVRRTVALCSAAGILRADHLGRLQPVKAASWRAGGVQTAAKAGLSDTMIMFLGRWTSSAWRAYMLHTPIDVQGAARRLWAVSAAGEPEGAELLGGKCGGAVPALLQSDEAAVAELSRLTAALAAFKATASVNAYFQSRRPRVQA